ncbi:peptidoglycan-binding domain-containing protein [Bacillus sp. M6-12]|uniref:peptidoglycan-binding domain-containing protein n=1 Tax=Bacillus sp. M6-12 TaxID=2054166 RepID=UPI0015E0C0BD|nr:peptidoglycan-binding protein [Bacillus sp. M6-12]
MKKWKKVTASLLTASALLMSVPSGSSAQASLDYSIFQMPQSGILKVGARGEIVKILQRALNQELKAGLTVDGVYGSKTKSAVLKFQKQYKSLKDTGIYDKSTHAELSKKVNSFGFANMVLKQGSRGEAVRTLQKGLNKVGIRISVDGVYGPATKAAVLKFQKRYPDVKDTGVFDESTRNLLDKVLHD